MGKGLRRIALGSLVVLSLAFLAHINMANADGWAINVHGLDVYTATIYDSEGNNIGEQYLAQNGPSDDVCFGIWVQSGTNYTSSLIGRYPPLIIYRGENKNVGQVTTTDIHQESEWTVEVEATTECN